MFTQFKNKQRIIVTTVLVGILSTYSVSAKIAVIVNLDNNSVLDKTSIERIFMGKMKKFPNGQVALPMNASKNMNSRDEFNKFVIGRF